MVTADGLPARAGAAGAAAIWIVTTGCHGASGVQHAQRGEHLEQNRADPDLGSTASKKVRALVVPERVAVGLGRVAR